MADDLKATGLATAADMVRGAVEAEADEAEQLSLLPGLPLGESRPAGGEAAVQGQGRRGPGRPKGAQNKSTTKWTEFLLTRYRSPVETQLSIANRPLKDLRRDLEDAGFTVKATDGIELLKLQMTCANNVAPYLHQKQPTAIQAEGSGFVLALGTFGGGEEGVDGDVGVTLPWSVESEENQGFTDAEWSEVERAQSNGSAQAVDNADFPEADPLIADQSDDGAGGAEGGR